MLNKALFVLLITTANNSLSDIENVSICTDHVTKHEVVAVYPDRNIYLFCNKVTQIDSLTGVLDVRALLQNISEDVLEGVPQRKEPAPDIQTRSTVVGVKGNHIKL